MLYTSRPASLAGLVVLAVWLAPASKTLAQASADPSAGASSGEISFAKEIAPILAANCAGCHRPGQRGYDRGNLDLTTYENIMKGAAGGGPTVVAGKPEESHMILRVTGKETPRMPPGNDVALSKEAIGRIERWIAAGAKLDPGLEPKAELASYAATARDLARAELAKLSPDERLKLVEETGRERWGQTNPDLKPVIVSSDHFAVFGVMNKERANATLKTLEGALGQLKKAVSPDVADWPERVSLYVFPDHKDYTEFIRTFKRREVVVGEEGDADLKTPQPYVVILDPGEEEPQTAAPKRGASRRRGAAAAAEGDDRRTSSGLLTEHLVKAAVLEHGKSPAWLAEGLSLYFAQQAERGGARYQRLRALAFDAFRQGWTTKATETLGGVRGVAADEFQGISFGLVECLASPQYQRLFPAFAKGMSAGPEKLDDVVKEVYGAPRDVFLRVTGEWIAANYGRAR